MTTSVTMDRLRAAGIPAELAALVIQLARQAERPQIKGDRGPQGQPGESTGITVFTSEGEFDAYVPGALELAVLTGA